MSRYDAFVKKLKDAVLSSDARTSADVRRAIFDGNTTAVPASLTPYVETVRQHAHRVTDEHVAQLKRDGHSEDEIFEATSSAALGAALHRLERGMSVLKGRRA